MPAIFLGTSGYHPSAVRHTAGVCVPEASLLLDAGSGTFRLPETLDVKLGERRELDLVLSHAHLDHIIGLTFFIVWLEENRFGTIRLHAEDRVHEAIDQHLFSDLIFPVRIPFERKSVRPGDTIELAGGHRLTLWSQPHRGITLGMRLDDASGHSLAYCTDVTARPGEDIDPIRKVHHLIHECHFANRESHLSERTGHSHLSAVAERAHEAAVGHTWLTHINPYYPPTQPLDLTGIERMTVAEDGMAIDWTSSPC